MAIASALGWIKLPGHAGYLLTSLFPVSEADGTRAESGGVTLDPKTGG